MQIRILYTGGTIGMRQTPSGLAPGADLRSWLAACIEPTLPAGIGLSYDELDPLIDSSDATPESWQQVVDAIRAPRDEADSGPAPDAFVVLHGTDTMAYTAAAFSYALAGANRAPRVVLTGAQLPFGASGSDAATNVAGAIHAACDPRAAGVTLFFGQHLLQGNRAVKDSSWSFEAYRSPNMPPLATAGASWSWTSQSGTSHTTNRPYVPLKPYTQHDVAILDMAPGISSARLRAMLDPLPEAVILRAYGVGTIPAHRPGMVELLNKLASASIPVIVCSQCPQARVDLERYATGSALACTGATSALDMTFEAAYAKTVFLLSQGLRGRELASWIPRPLAGELTPEALEGARV